MPSVMGIRFIEQSVELVKDLVWTHGVKVTEGY